MMGYTEVTVSQLKLQSSIEAVANYKFQNYKNVQLAMR
jgi:hypothetical protein